VKEEMIKKIAALAGTGALFLSVTGSVFAQECPGPSCWLFGLSRETNVANVINTAVAVSDTGGNSQTDIAHAENLAIATVDGGTGNRNLTTGSADSYAGSLVVANVGYDGCCCGCLTPCVSLEEENNIATVTNAAQAQAYTGDNYQDDAAWAKNYGLARVTGASGNRNLTSGPSSSETHSWTVVNFRWNE